MVSFILPGNSASGEYEVANSLRFDGASSAYLSKTFGSSGNRKTFTVSFWVKKCELATNPDTMSDAQMLFGGQQDSYPAFNIIFLHTNDTIFLKDAQASNNIQISIKSDFKFRDPAAWYHVVFAIDTTQSTASNRAKLYINGVQQTDLAGENATGGASDDPLYPDQNQDLQFNSNTAHYINKYASNYEDMYMAEFVFVDGQQLDATSFGEFDSDSNIWKPKDVSGLTFGTNGFYLDFEDSSSLGNDAAGSNNWTTNNITATDQSTDTCTNNFVTWNPLDNARSYSGSIDLSEGNLRQSNSNDASLISTIALNSGKWYMEFKCEDADNTRTFGIIDIAESNGYVGHSSVASAVSYGYKSSDGTLWIGTSQQASSVGTTSAGDIVSMAIDLDSSTKTIKWQKNGSDLSGTTQLTISHSTSDYYFGIICRCDGGQIISANFGSPAYSISSGNSDANGYGNFEYAVPSGYYALNTKNLAEYG